VLELLPLLACSDDFVFDNQMLVQAVHFGLTRSRCRLHGAKPVEPAGVKRLDHGRIGFRQRPTSLVRALPTACWPNAHQPDLEMG